MANMVTTTALDSGILAHFLSNPAPFQCHSRNRATPPPAHHQPNKSPALRPRRHRTTLALSPAAAAVATGALLFLADLVRRVDAPLALDFVRVESYGAGTESSGAPRITSDLKGDVAGKHVVVVEDIVDTGNTLSCLIAHLEKKGASSVSVCTFVDKPARRKVNIQLVGDGKFYRGFECPDYFVVGYGMDYAELYRNLPYVGVLKPEKYKKDSSN